MAVDVARGFGLGRTATGLLASLLVLVATLPVFGDLQRDLERAIANAGLDGMDIGVSVVDLRSGRRLAEINAFEPLIPASNMKLLTSASALLSLGDDFVFDTRFILDGEKLIVVGSGDPGLGDPTLLSALPEPMDIEALVDFIANAIAQSGAKTIREVVIDDRAFDREAVHPSWPRDQLQYYYCAEVGGLNFHLNVVNVYARPTTLNQPARVVIEPNASGVEIENTTTTVPSRTSAGRAHASAIHIRREGNGNHLLVSGQVSRSEGAPTAVRDTAILFGEMLAERLEKSGVVIGLAHGLPSDAVRRIGESETYEGRPVLVIKTPITEVMRRCNTDSYNLHAEALFKTLGHALTGQSGSWALGAASMRSILVDAIGPGSLDGLRISDGSGMSRNNAVAPATLTALLAHMNIVSDEGVRTLFRESLAQSGEGTLSRNFLSTRELRGDVRAKTGYLNGVRAITGYVMPKGSSEPTVAFSILMNDFTAGQSLRSRELRNELVRIIDRVGAGQGAGAVVVEPDAP
ncbi:MAG: D-alanyl-D-alanine carboxypeptidase/D-alanyl-D-alanine-endopeptidase [Phycisphaerales bacterium JB064]